MSSRSSNPTLTASLESISCGVSYKPQLFPDGNTMYFTSNRDGFMCMWAMRLDPKTKRPLGAPFPIQHFHAASVYTPAFPRLTTWN